jgi:hypothetical protein
MALVNLLLLAAFAANLFDCPLFFRRAAARTSGLFSYIVQFSRNTFAPAALATRNFMLTQPCGFVNCHFLVSLPPSLSSGLFRQPLLRRLCYINTASRPVSIGYFWPSALYLGRGLYLIYHIDSFCSTSVNGVYGSGTAKFPRGVYKPDYMLVYTKLCSLLEI